MLQFVWEVKGWLTSNYTFDKREANKDMKSGLHAVGAWWHKNFLPFHFERAAYGRYHGDIGRRKKRGKPLVVKGNLRRRLVGTRRKVKITSTSNHVTVKMPFGNPANKTKEELDKDTFILMKQQNLDFKTARRIVSRQNAFNEVAKTAFRQNLTAVSKKEERVLAGVLRDHLKRNLERRAASMRSKRKLTRAA